MRADDHKNERACIAHKDCNNDTHQPHTSSMESVQLHAIESGDYDAPAENTTVKVKGGPWTKKQACLFRRTIGQSAADWRKKVLDSATEAVRACTAHGTATASPCI